MLGDNWSVIECPECAGKFKAPPAANPGETIPCPACGAMVGVPAARAARAAKATAEPAEPAGALPAKPAGALPGGKLPPAKKKAVDLDLSSLVVKEANRQFKPRTGAPGRAAPVKGVAKTSDEEFAPVEEAPRERMMSAKQRQEIVGWDDDEPTADGEGGRGKLAAPTTASTLKMFLIAAPLVILVAIFALNVRSKKIDKPAPPPVTGVVAAGGSAADAEPSAESVDGMYKELGRTELYKRVVEVVHGFLAAENIEQRLKYSRAPERVRPLMERYYATHPDRPIEVREIASEEVAKVALGFVVLDVTLPNFERLPIVIARDGDSLVVDWESFVGYSEMSLEEFVAKKPTEPVLFRVRAQPSDYFNYDFDSKTYHCVSIYDLKFRTRLFGYVRKNSAIAETMTTQVLEGTLDFVILKLSFPEDPKSDNQVVVDEFVGAGWLIK